MPFQVATTPTRVLVADGHRAFGDILCRALLQDGRFDVVGTVGTGDEAVSFATPFDLALVDIGIRGLDSLLTVSRLQERMPAPTAVLLTTTDAVYLRHAAAAQGAAGLLVLPDHLDQLGDRLARLLERSETRLGVER